MFDSTWLTETKEEGTQGSPDYYVKRMGASENVLPTGLPDYTEHMRVIEHCVAVGIAPPDTEDTYGKAKITDSFSVGDRPRLGEAGDITCDLHNPDEPAGYDIAFEGLHGLECVHGDDAPEQRAFERADGVGNDDQFSIPSQTGGQLVDLDSTAQEADTDLALTERLADGGNAPMYVFPPMYVVSGPDDEEASTHIMTDPDTVHESLESPCDMVSDADDAPSPALSSVTGDAAGAGDDAIYEYADVTDDPSAVHLRCSEPNASTAATVTDGQWRNTLWQIPDEATYELATIRRGKTFSAMHRWSKQSKRTKAVPEAPAPIRGRTASKLSAKRWSKDLKQKKRVVPLETDAAGGYRPG